MKDIQKLLNYIWLLNAEVNSLNEPKMLAKECLEKIEELKGVKLSSAEIEVFKKEFSDAVSYLSSVKEMLGELEIRINNVTDEWSGR